MLTCITRSKQTPPVDPEPSPSSADHPPPDKPNTNAVKSLSSQIKDMALKASGCAPCAIPPSPSQQRRPGGGELESERFRWSYRRTGSSNSSSTAGRRELEARLKGISSGDGTPASASGRRAEPVVFVEESEPKEWVAQVEPGVLITFVSLPRGGNDLKRIRFSREMFNKWQAQKWWSDNCEKLMELYNVQRLNRPAFPLPSTPKSEDESSSKIGSIHNSPVTPSLGRERYPRNRNSPSDYDSFNGVASTPSISGTKTEISSTSMTTGSSREVEDISISNVSYLESEWVEEDEEGVYITIRALPDGRRELRRVRFSREKFGEVHARLWWEENRARVHKQYL